MISHSITRPAVSRPAERGSTLVEVLFGLVILAASVVAVAQLSGFATRNNAVSGDLTTTTNLADTKMQQLESTSYDALPVGSVVDNVPVGGITYRRTTTITDNSPLPGMRKLEVAVAPQRGTGASAGRGATTLTSYAHRPPIEPMAPMSAGSPAMPRSPTATTSAVSM